MYGVLIAFHSSVLLHLSDGPMWKQIAGRESDNCQTNWWTNVLFVNNYVNEEQPVSAYCKTNDLLCVVKTMFQIKTLIKP